MEIFGSDDKGGVLPIEIGLDEGFYAGFPLGQIFVGNGKVLHDRVCERGLIEFT